MTLAPWEDQQRIQRLMDDARRNPPPTTTPTPHPQTQLPSGRLPDWHENRRLGQLRTDGPYAQTEHAITLASRWVARVRSGYPPNVGLLFWGPVGTGKTSVAAAIAVELGEPHGCQWWDVRALLDKAKDEFRGPAKTLPRVAVEPVLLLDDVGRLRATEWRREALCDLVERRFDRRRLTVVSTNLDAGELRAFLGDAAFSRLAAMTFSVHVDGVDLRGVQ